jgi:hypothetical protein
VKSRGFYLKVSRRKDLVRGEVKVRKGLCIAQSLVVLVHVDAVRVCL